MCCYYVTTDKVYDNGYYQKTYVESDRLGGQDPYSASKAATEMVAQSWQCFYQDNDIRVATARAGNVIGGGDWSEDRLIPDLARVSPLGRLWL